MIGDQEYQLRLRLRGQLSKQFKLCVGKGLTHNLRKRFMERRVEQYYQKAKGQAQHFGERLSKFRGDFLPSFTGGVALRLVGASLLAATLTQLETRAVYGQGTEDGLPNISIDRLPRRQFAHPTTEKEDGEEVWSYGFSLRHPDLEGMSVRGTGNVGEILLTGCSTGIDLAATARFLGDYRGSGVRSAAWIQAAAGDVITVLDGENLPYGQTAADENGFAGVLVPSETEDSQFAVRVHRVDPANCNKAVKVTLGNLSQEDAAKPGPSVIDAATGQTGPFSSPAPEAIPPTPTPAPTPRVIEQAPPFLAELPVSTFAEAPADTFFLAKSSQGVGWTHTLEFALPNKVPGVFYTDKGNVGEMFVLTRDGATNFDLYFRVNPLFINDLKQGAENRAAIWIKTQPGALIQLLDADRQVVTQRGADGKVTQVEVRADGAGFGGFILPENQAVLGMRVVMANAKINADTQIQLGPEKPVDRGKPSTLDSSPFIR